jgi:hypothetical protein
MESLFEAIRDDINGATLEGLSVIITNEQNAYLKKDFTTEGEARQFFMDLRPKESLSYKEGMDIIVKKRN